VTPHLGASTHEAQKAVSLAAAEQLLAYLRGQGINGAVNAPGLKVDLTPEQERFVDLAQRMSTLINPMISQGIGAVTFEITGKTVAAAAGTLERLALINLFRGHLDVPLNLINVRNVAEQRGIKLRTVVADDDGAAPQKLSIEVRAAGNGSEIRRIVGIMLPDRRPRVVDINRYHMDMVPAGVMVLIQNEDRPGMIGLVGTEFGQASVNIADMAISRRDGTALMVLKLDTDPPESLLNRLRHRPGILKIAVVKLPTENP